MRSHFCGRLWIIQHPAMLAESGFFHVVCRHGYQMDKQRLRHTQTPDTPSGSSCDPHSKGLQSVTKINTVFVVDRSLVQVYDQVGGGKTQWWKANMHLCLMTARQWLSDTVPMRQRRMFASHHGIRKRLTLTGFYLEPIFLFAIFHRNIYVLFTVLCIYHKKWVPAILLFSGSHQPLCRESNMSICAGTEWDLWSVAWLCKQMYPGY